MSSKRREINIQLNQLVDALLLGLIFWGCYQLRAAGVVIMDSLWEIPEFTQFLWILAILMPFGPFLLEMQGFYTNPLDKPPGRAIGQILRAGIWLLLLLAVAAFFLKLSVPSRSVLVLFAVVAPLALLVKDRIVVAMQLRKLSLGASAEPILVAGEPDRIREFERSLTPLQRMETTVVDTVDLAHGNNSDLVEALHRHSVGRVILAFGRLELDKIQQAVEACETEGVEAWLSADFIRTSIARPTFENFGGAPMLVFRATPEISWALIIKNAIDRAGAIFLLLVLSPLFAATALAVRMGSKGPAIFRQQRAGLYGKPFVMYKFRTMVAGAEDQQKELEGLNQMKGPVFKIEDDPRITKVGRFLRRTSIDELPQLLNVLRGEMSLVGPRPLPLYEVAKFESAGHRRRLSMKPGLTCLWQVRGRNHVRDFDDWVRMDLEYIDNWSLGLDFTILLRTIPAVLWCWGAK